MDPSRAGKNDEGDMATPNKHQDLTIPELPKQEVAVSPSSSPALNRRSLLKGTAVRLGAAGVHAVSRGLEAKAELVPEDPAKVPGGAATSYGRRSAFEHGERLAKPNRSRTPLQLLHGIVTPSALHFERHHNGIPLINPARHRLLIHGLVERPLVFTVDDIKRFPSVSRLAFIECSGNSGSEWKEPGKNTVQDIHGLTSTSEWTGVPLAVLLREVGMKPEARWMLAEGGDAAALTRSIPIAPMLDQALVCYAQNGEALRPEQGYPLRLLLPGWEGNTNIKWLRRLKLGAAPFMTREETARYTDLMPDGTARQFTMEMEAKSVITSPSGGERIRERGFLEIRGLAWSGRGRVTAVEVSVDGGKHWAAAELQDPVLPMCHTRFRYPWRWEGQAAIIQSRCTDETGYVQPTRRALIRERGTNSSYHYHAIQSWRIMPDGTVQNVHV